MQFDTPATEKKALGAVPDKTTMEAMKLKGLPFTVNKEDIVQFFDGFNLKEDSVKIGKMADGKLTGEAAVLFETADDCNNAHQELN